MPQSLSKILIHVVFSTKNHHPFITPELEIELYPYMATILRNNDSPSLAINGSSDHVHMIVSLSRKITLSNLMEIVKKYSSKWIKTKHYWSRMIEKDLPKCEESCPGYSLLQSFILL